MTVRGPNEWEVDGVTTGPTPTDRVSAEELVREVADMLTRFIGAWPKEDPFRGEQVAALYEAADTIRALQAELAERKEQHRLVTEHARQLDEAYESGREEHERVLAELASAREQIEVQIDQTASFQVQLEDVMEQLTAARSAMRTAAEFCYYVSKGNPDAARRQLDMIHDVLDRALAAKEGG